MAVMGISPWPKIFFTSGRVGQGMACPWHAVASRVWHAVASRVCSCRDTVG